jgi:uncharacterized protein (TIGR02117 family)
MRSSFFLMLCLLLSSCASMPRSQDIPVANTRYIIYVIYRGWHTSILLDAKPLAEQSPLLEKELRGQKYARIGFGDGDYFTGKDKSVSSATKALFVSDYSALQVLTYDYEPFAEIPADTMVSLALTEEGMRNLIRHINKSIALDAQGNAARLPALGDAMGSFYRGNIHYSAFSNCNTWLGQALRDAGLPVASRLTSAGVFEQAKAIFKVQTRAGLFKVSPVKASEIKTSQSKILPINIFQATAFSEAVSG